MRGTTYYSCGTQGVCIYIFENMLVAKICLASERINSRSSYITHRRYLPMLPSVSYHSTRHRDSFLRPANITAAAAAAALVALGPKITEFTTCKNNPALAPSRLISQMRVRTVLKRSTRENKNKNSTAASRLRRPLIPCSQTPPYLPPRAVQGIEGQGSQKATNLFLPPPLPPRAQGRK